MKIDGERLNILLSQINKLNDILYWQYNHKTKQLDFSNQIINYFEKESCPTSDKKIEDFLVCYINAVFPMEREKLKEIIFGNTPETEGSFNYRIQLSGQTHYHKCFYTCFKEKEAEIVIGVITDETYKIKAEKQTLEKESVFKHIADHSNIGIYSWNPISGECNVNKSWYSNFGIPLELPLIEALGKFNTQVHPEDIDRLQEARKALREGTRQSMDETFRLYCNNKLRWVRYAAVVKTFDIEHADIQIISLNQDITSLKIQEERNTKIIEALPDFIFIFDKNFFIQDLLKGSSIKLLHSVEELIGADGYTIFSKEVSDLYKQTIQDCLQDKTLKEIEYYLDVNEERYYFQARMVPFDEELVIALIHDIGNRMRFTNELIEAKQKAEEADRMKSTFLANMSHEIRTPLNAIVGFSEILSSAETPEEKEGYLEIIRTNSNILLQLINDVLDLSRIESGKTETIFQRVELNELLNEVYQVHKLKMKPEVELKLALPEEKIWTMTDRNKITQVLFNFMSNAIKNTQKGSITLRLTADNARISIAVADTGVGIPQDKLKLVFERFIKLNDFVQGTGLGLTICKTIADKLGGRLNVESEFSQGSTFSIELPRVSVDQEVSMENNLLIEDKTMQEENSQKTILIAEDVEANFRLAQAILHKQYKIIHAVNGEEAIDKFITESPDIILMDIKMPVMDGIEATRRIRKISPIIPIIALTAHAFYTEQQIALDAGCSDIISKPYTPTVLKETVLKYLQK